MKKNILALAVAGALVAPMVAMADVEVYGKAHVSTGQLDNSGTDGKRLFMETNNSNVGFRGTEDLGGGLKAMYQAEVGMNWDGGTGATGTGAGWGAGRDTWVGLGGDWGAVLLGRMNSPYKMSTNDYDPFADTFADYNGILGVSPTGQAHDIRLSNTIAYATNTISGFKGVLGYAMNDGVGINTAAKVDALELSLNYGMGPLSAAVGYSNISQGGYTPTGATKADNNSAWKIGAGYKFGNDNTAINAVYENIDAGTNGAATDKASRAAYYVSATQKVEAWKFALGYGSAAKIKGLDDTGATMYQLGAFYSLSKATQTYVAYSQVKDKTNTKLYGLKADSFVPSANGESAKGLMVGIIHNFSSK